MQTIVYPGTFDPITLGHLNLIERTGKLADKLIVAIALNPNKKPMFTLEERVDMARIATQHLDNVDVVGFEGLILDLVQKLQGNIVLRGVRSMTDFDYEMAMAMTNKQLNEKYETIFLCPEPHLSHISSTFVREISNLGGDVSKFLTPEVNQSLLDKLQQNHVT
jgi:pantetheine-phosphate adenylyltransferase